MGTVARQIAAIAVKELKILLRDWQALLLLFVMPAFFILVMSFALRGVFETGTESRPLEILLVNQDEGELAGKTIKELKRISGITLVENGQSNKLTREQAEAAIRRGSQRFALVFGQGYSARIRGVLDNTSHLAIKPDPAAVSLLVDPTINQQLQAMVSGMVSGTMERVRLATQLPATIAEAMDPGAGVMAGMGLNGVQAEPDESDPEIEAIIGDDSQRIALAIELPQGFNRERRPSATEQNVPAYAIFGVFFIVLTIAKSFLHERQSGTFVRLLTAPLSKAHVIVGKLLPYYFINLLQIALMFSVGVVVFDMGLGNMPAFIVVSLATAATANALGLMVAAFGRSEAQVDTLAVVLATTLAALGGIMVPSFVMPDGLRTLSLATPHAWALAGYQDVIVRGLGLPDVWFETMVLCGFASVFLLIGLWRLRLN